MAEHPENATLADAIGFSPEGARTALFELGKLENKLTVDDWKPDSLIGDNANSALPDLMGIMTRLPQLQKGLEELKGSGNNHKKLADITHVWVEGKSLAEIANAHFTGGTYR